MIKNFTPAYLQEEVFNADCKAFEAMLDYQQPMIIQTARQGYTNSTFNVDPSLKDAIVSFYETNGFKVTTSKESECTIEISWDKKITRR